MTDTRYDRAPGDISISVEAEEKTSSDIGIYAIGLALAVVLTATSFWVANTSLLWGPGVHLGLAVLAIAQMGVHLVFFLHISTGPDSNNNVLAVAFGVLIVFLVVAGSLWIMADLNGSMMPAAGTRPSLSEPARRKRSSQCAPIRPTDRRWREISLSSP